MSETPPHGPYVAGVDTSLTSTGVVLMGGRTLATTIGQEGTTLLPLERRTLAIAEQAAQIFDAVTAQRLPSGRPVQPRSHPALVLIEAPDVSNSYGGLVERVSLTYELTRALVDFGVPVGWVPSAVLKGYATGSGGSRDGKTRVRAAALGLWPELGIDKAKPKKSQFDLADAAVLAAMALDVLGLGRRVPSPQADEWLCRATIQYPDFVRTAPSYPPLAA